MAELKAFLAAMGGSATYAGSSNAYTITNAAAGAWSAYAAGQLIALKANHTNSGASTVNVDGLGAKSIKTCDGGDVVSGDIVSGGIYLLSYDGTNFQVLNTLGGGSYQPLDATLTALSALTWSSGSPVVQFTAADTVSLTSTPTLSRLLLPDGSGASPALRIGDEENGWFSPAAFQLGAAINGTHVATISAVAFNLAINSLVLRLSDGTVSAPGAQWNSDTDSGFYRIGADNVGLALNGALQVDFSTSRVAFTPPITARVADSSETTGALTSASRNRRVVCAGGVTLPASGMTAGDFVLLDPGGTARTITRPAAHTMYVRDTDSATATSYAHNLALAVFHGSSKYTLHGVT